MKLLTNVLKGVLPVVVLVLGLLGARALVGMREEAAVAPPDVPPPLVDALVARPGALRFHVEAHGTVVPRTESRLVAEVAGRVVEVPPELADGAYVEEGQLLARIDPRDYDLALEQAKLSVARAERTLAEEEAEAELAREEWAEMGDGDATPLTRREPQVAEARAALEAARAGLERARRDLARTELRAPYAGRVREKLVDRGQYVMPGTPVATMYAVDFVEVRLPVADDELAFLDLDYGYRGEAPRADGPEVLVSADFAGGRHEWRGRVVRTEGEIDPATRMVVLVARVDDPYGRGEERDRPPLSIGMFVRAEVLGRRVEEAYVLPRTALRGTGRVFVVDEDDRLRFRAVEVLRSGHDDVVVGEGLAPGERVVTSPMQVATDGMLVRLPEEDEPEPARAAAADGGDAR